MRTSKEIRALLYEMKCNGEIVAFATFEKHNKLTCIDVVLDDCTVMVERNE